MEQSVDGPRTARLVLHPIRIVAQDVFMWTGYHSVTRTAFIYLFITNFVHSKQTFKKIIIKSSLYNNYSSIKSISYLQYNVILAKLCFMCNNSAEILLLTHLLTFSVCCPACSFYGFLQSHVIQISLGLQHITRYPRQLYHLSFRFENVILLLSLIGMRNVDALTENFCVL